MMRWLKGTIVALLLITVIGQSIYIYQQRVVIESIINMAELALYDQALRYEQMCKGMKSGFN